jgi:hypothetical protein
MLCDSGRLCYEDWAKWNECNPQCGRRLMTRKRKVVTPLTDTAARLTSIARFRLCWGSNCKVACMGEKHALTNRHRGSIAGSAVSAL